MKASWNPKYGLIQDVRFKWLYFDPISQSVRIRLTSDSEIGSKYNHLNRTSCMSPYLRWFEDVFILRVCFIFYFLKYVAGCSTYWANEQTILNSLRFAPSSLTKRMKCRFSLLQTIFHSNTETRFTRSIVNPLLMKIYSKFTQQKVSFNHVYDSLSIVKRIFRRKRPALKIKSNRAHDLNAIQARMCSVSIHLYGTILRETWRENF